MKIVSQPEYKHKLYLGEQVEFVKALGPKGFWATTRLSDFSSHMESESWVEEEGRPTWSAHQKSAEGAQ